MAKIKHVLHIICRGRLVEGHSIIVPTEHVASTRQVDDHIWTELRNFKKCILQMYMSQVPAAFLFPCFIFFLQHVHQASAAILFLLHE